MTWSDIFDIKNIQFVGFHSIQRQCISLLRVRYCINDQPIYTAKVKIDQQAGCMHSHIVTSDVVGLWPGTHIYVRVRVMKAYIKRLLTLL
jgi:hypothetical protein